MKVLTTSLDLQTINIQARELVFDEFVLKNEAENTSINIEGFIYSIGEWYTSISANFELTENFDYLMVLKNEGEVVYRSKILCTNQNQENYTVNENQYISPTSNNEFIFHE